jgi:hypothetical protein
MEKWKFIYNSKFYQVSNFGNIKGIGGTIIRKDGKPYTVKPCILKPCISKYGYMLIDLKLDIYKKYSVHRLVLEMFNPIVNMDKYQVNHIDGDKTNNNINNLEWVTREENMQHAMKIGLFNPNNRCGEKHPLCKLSHNDIEQIRDILNTKKYTQHSIAKIFNVSDATISEIKTGKKRSKN